MKRALLGLVTAFLVSASLLADEKPSDKDKPASEAKKEPPKKVGFMYMLAGGTDASNTDPYSERPRRGDPWVQTGPHLMVVGSEAILRGYPSGPRPNTAQPYVMWAGTPYQHLMAPVH